jgi:carboxyl-terminal processing protease
MPLADELRFARDLGALKITMQQFYRPSGDSTQNRGVVADVVLPSLSSHLPVGESDLDHSMAFDRVPTVNHADANMVTPSIVDQLRRGSDARRDRSEDFKRVERRAQRRA